MTEQQFERAKAVLENIETLRLSLESIDRFERDVPKLQCEYTRVSLLGTVTRDVQIPLELSGLVTRALRSALHGKIAQYKKELEEL